jgi:hypothetical protein
MISATDSAAAPLTIRSNLARTYLKANALKYTPNLSFFQHMPTRQPWIRDISWDFDSGVPSRDEPPHSAEAVRACGFVSRAVIDGSSIVRASDRSRVLFSPMLVAADPRE